MPPSLGLAKDESLDMIDTKETKLSASPTIINNRNYMFHGPNAIMKCQSQSVKIPRPRKAELRFFGCQSFCSGALSQRNNVSGTATCQEPRREQGLFGKVPAAKMMHPEQMAFLTESQHLSNFNRVSACVIFTMA